MTSRYRPARDLGQPPDEIRALDGLAHAHGALGHTDQARHLWQQALGTFAEFDLPTTEDVTIADIQASLAALEGTPPESSLG